MTPTPQPTECTLTVKSRTSSSVTLTLTLLVQVDDADLDGTNVTLPVAPKTTLDITRSTNGNPGQAVAIVTNTTG